jgi:acetylornithine deacetylase
LASTWPTEIALLRDLVAIPSLSGEEAAAAAHLAATARAFGLDVEQDETSVRIGVGDEAAGPTLALASHLDVVPPGDGWTRDPFVPTIEGDLLYGRGSGDAKASVAAMVTALADLRTTPLRGRVLGLFTFGEETRDATMPAAIARAGRLDAAIVGEPTNLDVAIAQRGLMMVDLVTRGTQRHAGHAVGPDFRNAVTALAADLLRLDGIVADRLHPVLGATIVTPTMLTAGVSRNVTPPEARAVLDIRSTPAWSHADLARALADRLESEVVVTSDRLVPCETPPDSLLLAAIREVQPEVVTYGSPTCSDWCYLRTLDAVKVGPGTSRRSHTADEAVNLSEVTAARHFYSRVAEVYLA